MLLIPMNTTQTDHLKAYGVVFSCLTHDQQAEWLLNYEYGSFLIKDTDDNRNLCLIRGVAYTAISNSDAADIYRIIESENMERVFLEKPPKIAVYSPSSLQPWDDAVRLALEYAEIEYDMLWDKEVIEGKLEEYDWLHLHHEDFTGQYGKFYASQRSQLWYQQDVIANEKMARSLGFNKVSECKKAVAREIKEYVLRGGFLFAMCSAAETLDIALAAHSVDIVPSEFDGDPVDPRCNDKLDYAECLAFTDFKVSINPLEYKRSTLDTYPARIERFMTPEDDMFYLFEFSAKLDPVPTMLVQNHVPVVDGFVGQVTAIRKTLLKKFVIVLGQPLEYDEIRYVHGNAGKGTFTFYTGHDPEDYTHRLNDPPTDLSLHKSSPGYRLILNNILFPAAKKKERKT
ncbi:MAG: asparagine synthetase B [candidate division Zixibacteria bacterium]|nr:asparagine synthetase B [candidate division Zixibacteria bacterium]